MLCYFTVIANNPFEKYNVNNYYLYESNKKNVINGYIRCITGA